MQTDNQEITASLYKSNRKVRVFFFFNLSQQTIEIHLKRNPTMDRSKHKVTLWSRRCCCPQAAGTSLQMVLKDAGPSHLLAGANPQLGSWDPHQPGPFLLWAGKRRVKLSSSYLGICGAVQDSERAVVTLRGERSLCLQQPGTQGTHPLTVLSLGKAKESQELSFQAVGEEPPVTSGKQTGYTQLGKPRIPEKEQSQASVTPFWPVVPLLAL